MAEVGKGSRQVEAISWALFLIWIGVAMLADIGWAWSLIGIGVIVLGTQGTLWSRDEKIDRFWVACGLVLLAGGIWVHFGLTWPLVPVLLVLLGLAMLANALFVGSAR